MTRNSLWQGRPSIFIMMFTITQQCSGVDLSSAVPQFSILKTLLAYASAVGG